MKRLSIVMGVFFLGCCGLLLADDAAVISAGDKQALEANTGKEATVEGTVSDAAWNSGGRVFVIKFKDAAASNFQGIIFSSNRDAMEKAFNGDLSNAFEGAKVQLKGPVSLYPRT